MRIFLRGKHVTEAGQIVKKRVQGAMGVSRHRQSNHVN